MDRSSMIEIAEIVIARQDDGDPDGVARYFAEGCTFMMPILAEPLQGRDALREHAKGWPTSTTGIEWVAIDGPRLTCCWNWQGDGEEWAATRPLRGVSTFVFDDDGLIATYEDWFDPGWATRLDVPS